jgi:hypothetical protein
VRAHPPFLEKCARLGRGCEAPAHRRAPRGGAVNPSVLMLLLVGTNVKGRNFIVWTENTTTESALRSRKSKDFHSNNKWKRIQELLIHKDIDITPLRVISKDNVADGLSRGVQRPHVVENRVWFNISVDLSPFMFHAWIFSFCHKINRLVSCKMVFL